jgi:hypothetical protein
MNLTVRRTALVLVSMVAAGAGAFIVSREQAVSSTSMTLTVSAAPGAVVSSADQFEITGARGIEIGVSQIQGGRATTVPGPGPDLGSAVRFPSYTDSPIYARLALTLTPEGGEALSPGSSDFEYGAVFRLDVTTSGSTVDNGDNLFQRGLIDQESQFKLELDRGYAACLVRGADGQLSVRADLKVVPERWYRATCSRTGSAVTVLVEPYAEGRSARVTVDGATGALTFDRKQAASVGGKVTPTGDLVRTATDQFNGAVAEVWIRRLG